HASQGSLHLFDVFLHVGDELDNPIEVGERVVECLLVGGGRALLGGDISQKFTQCVHGCSASKKVDRSERRLDQGFNIWGTTCLVIKSFTASFTMALASSSIFLALTPVALAPPGALKPWVLPSRGVASMRTLVSMEVGLS